MSGLVQAVGTGGCDAVCQPEPQWSWLVLAALRPTYCRRYSLIHVRSPMPALCRPFAIVNAFEGSTGAEGGDTVRLQ